MLVVAGILWSDDAEIIGPEPTNTRGAVRAWVNRQIVMGRGAGSAMFVSQSRRRADPFEVFTPA